jgi:type I restriction enzyme R subunit
VIGESIEEAGGVVLVNDLARQDNIDEWSDEKTRNETDIIKSRLKRTIEQDLTDDPYAQLHFSALLRQAIAEAQAMFGNAKRQYALFRELEAEVASRHVEGTPHRVAGNRHAAAYFGVMRLQLGDEAVLGSDVAAYEDLALAIDEAVRVAVAENSLNPQNIEAAIRKALLPMLFPYAGLDHAKAVTERVIEITRVGLSPGMQ